MSNRFIRDAVAPRIFLTHTELRALTMDRELVRDIATGQKEADNPEDQEAVDLLERLGLARDPLALCACRVITKGTRPRGEFVVIQFGGDLPTMLDVFVRHARRHDTNRTPEGGLVEYRCSYAYWTDSDFFKLYDQGGAAWVLPADDGPVRWVKTMDWLDRYGLWRIAEIDYHILRCLKGVPESWWLMGQNYKRVLKGFLPRTEGRIEEPLNQLDVAENQLACALRARMCMETVVETPCPDPDGDIVGVSRRAYLTDAAVDVVANIFHWCDLVGVDIDHVLRRARRHFEADKTIGEYPRGGPGE